MPATHADHDPPDLAGILRREIQVAVILAEGKMTLSRVLETRAGSVLRFDKHADEALHLRINGTTVAHGSAVRVGDRLGVRITRVADLPRVIRSLAGTNAP